jgi:hypothetical protein
MAFVQLVSRLDDLTEYIRTISVASDIGIKILGASGQSGDHIRIVDVTDTTVHFNVDANGDVGIGASPSSANLDMTRTRTDTSGTWRGIYSNLTASPASNSSSSFRSLNGSLTLTGSANFTGSCFGLSVLATHSGTGTVTNLFSASCNAQVTNGGTATQATALNAQVTLSTVASTISTAVGGQFTVINSISGGVITSSQSILAATPTVSAGATINTQEGLRVNNQGAAGITTSYGIRVRSQTGASTSHAIFSEGGQSTLQSGAAATVVLILQGAASQTGDLLRGIDNNSNINAFIAATGAGAFKPRDAVTNAITTGLTVGHNTSGTAAAAFGTKIQFVLESSTTEDRAIAEISAEWETATDASRKGLVKLNVYDTAVRECLRFGTDGANPMIGFLGAAHVARTAAYAPTNVTTDRSFNANSTTIDELADVIGTMISDLQSFGLYG